MEEISLFTNTGYLFKTIKENKLRNKWEFMDIKAIYKILISVYQEEMRKYSLAWVLINSL